MSTGLLLETKIKSMRHISTLFFCLILLLSAVCAQDSSNLKDRALKILDRQQLPFTTSNTEPVTIRMRCMGTQLNNEPLLIIDGIVADKFELGNINPDNIESICILKDQMATTLFCRVGSGAIIITTKTANNRTITVKDMLTGEILAGANVDLISMDGRKDTTHLISDSSGKIVTNKIVYGNEYELTTTCVGYKSYRWLTTSKTFGKNYTVLLLKESKPISLVKNQEPITAMCYNLKTVQSNELIFKKEPGSDQFRVFPIPAKPRSEIKIQWGKATTGEYAVELYNLQGQLIKSSFASIGNETNGFAFQIPAITSGSYLLQMTNKKSGKKHCEKIIIQ